MKRGLSTTSLSFPSSNPLKDVVYLLWWCWGLSPGPYSWARNIAPSTLGRCYLKFLNIRKRMNWTKVETFVLFFSLCFSVTLDLLGTVPLCHSGVLAWSQYTLRNNSSLFPPHSNFSQIFPESTCTFNQNAPQRQTIFFFSPSTTFPLREGFLM